MEPRTPGSTPQAAARALVVGQLESVLELFDENMRPKPGVAVPPRILELMAAMEWEQQQQQQAASATSATPATTPTTAAAFTPAMEPAALESAEREALQRLVWPSGARGDADVRSMWFDQGLDFTEAPTRETASSTFPSLWIISQPRNGPCGLLSALTAWTYRYLFANEDGEREQTAEAATWTPLRVASARADAVATMLFMAATAPSYAACDDAAAAAQPGMTTTTTSSAAGAAGAAGAAATESVARIRLVVRVEGDVRSEQGPSAVHVLDAVVGSLSAARRAIRAVLLHDSNDGESNDSESDPVRLSAASLVYSLALSRGIDLVAAELQGVAAVTDGYRPERCPGLILYDIEQGQVGFCEDALVSLAMLGRACNDFTEPAWADWSPPSLRALPPRLPLPEGEGKGDGDDDLGVKPRPLRPRRVGTDIGMLCEGLHPQPAPWLRLPRYSAWLVMRGGHCTTMVSFDGAAIATAAAREDAQRPAQMHTAPPLPSEKKEAEEEVVSGTEEGQKTKEEGEEGGEEEEEEEEEEEVPFAVGTSTEATFYFLDGLHLDYAVQSISVNLFPPIRVPRGGGKGKRVKGGGAEKTSEESEAEKAEAAAVAAAAAAVLRRTLDSELKVVDDIIQVRTIKGGNGVERDEGGEQGKETENGRGGDGGGEMEGGAGAADRREFYVVCEPGGRLEGRGTGTAAAAAGGLDFSALLADHGMGQGGSGVVGDARPRDPLARWYCRSCYVNVGGRQYSFNDADSHVCKGCGKAEAEAGWGHWLAEEETPAGLVAAFDRRRAPALLKVVRTQWHRAVPQVVPRALRAMSSSVLASAAAAASDGSE